MSKFKVYVAAPYADASLVRMIHEKLKTQDIGFTSSWAEEAKGAENFAAFSPERLREHAEANDGDVREANALLALARDGAGGEMFAEARIALEWGIPVVWVGRRILSAWRDGVALAEDLDNGIQKLARMRGLFMHANVFGLPLARACAKP